MFLFQPTEPFHQLVILAIGNLRIVLNVVKLVVAMDLVAEFVDYLFDGGLLGQPVLVVPETLSESSLLGLSASERRGVVFDFAHCISIINSLFAIGALVVFEIRHDISDALIFIRPIPTHPSNLITAAGRTCLYSNHCFGSLGPIVDFRRLVFF